MMDTNTEIKPLVMTQQELQRVLGAVCLIILDNGYQSLYVHGEPVDSACGASGEPSLEDLAKRIARALKQQLRQVELPVPEAENWCWNDITEELVTRANVIDVRAIVTIIESEIGGDRAIHFCSHPVLSGSNHDLWFPLQADEELFAAVERVMTMNNMAVNVTSLLPGNKYPKGADWDVVYNQKLALS